MKKTKLSIVAGVLAACTLFATACGDTSSSTVEDDPKLLQAPDYSKYTHRFDSYAYSGPSDGYYKVDKEPFYVGEDFRTKERYEEYAAAGFTIYLPQNNGVKIASDFNEEIWAEEKVYMDRAYEAGLKIVLNDQRLQYLSKLEGSLIGVDDPETPEVEEYRFASEDALDDYVRRCMALYKDHPGFYGLMLGDEPRIYHLQAYGQMYQAFKRVAPDMYIQYNLLPNSTVYNDKGGVDNVDDDVRFPELTEEETDPNWTETQIDLKRYEKYLNMFMDVMPGIGFLQFDDYPIHSDNIDADYLSGLQIAAKVCKERDLELHVVSQSCGMYSSGPDGYLYLDALTKEDCQWMNNVLLGFGVKQIHYFTYWTKADQSTTGEYFIDGASFVTYGGEKTDLYYWMQEIMANNQKFAPVIKQFNYQGSKSYLKTPTNFDRTQVDYVDNSYEFKKLTNVEIEKEIGLVTELYDAENNNYMYMIMNLVGGRNEGSRAYQTNVVTFSSEYTHVVVYRNGVGTPQKLGAGNTLEVEVAPGEAVFVLPY